jgi:alpha-mannosidase
VQPENIIVTVIKRAEDNDDLIIRCYESAKTATEASISLPRWNREIVAQFGPSEIKTFRIPREPKLPVRETNLLEWLD